VPYAEGFVDQTTRAMLSPLVRLKKLLESKDKRAMILEMVGRRTHTKRNQDLPQRSPFSARHNVTWCGGDLWEGSYWRERVK